MAHGKGDLFIDMTLPFGLRSVPKVYGSHRCSGVGDQARGCKGHLDDFLISEALNTGECSIALTKVLEVLGRLSLPVTKKKLEGPTTCLGFILDSQALETRLPLRKLTELQELLGRIGMFRYALCTSIFSSRVPLPWKVTMLVACFTPTYVREVRCSLTPSLTLIPSGEDMYTVSLHSHDDPFGITLNLLVCAIGTSVGFSGPWTLPSLHSTARYYHLRRTPYYGVTF